MSLGYWGVYAKNYPLGLHDCIVVTVNKSLWFRYGLVVAWMAVIFVFSHQPSEVSSGQSGWVIEQLQSATGWEATEKVIRKSAHALVYAVLGVLVLWTIRGHGVGWRRAVPASTAIVLLYACSDELHQMYVPGRSAEAGDVLLDTAAGLVAIGIYVIIYKIYRRSHEKR